MNQVQVNANTVLFLMLVLKETVVSFHLGTVYFSIVVNTWIKVTVITVKLYYYHSHQYH